MKIYLLTNTNVPIEDNPCPSTMINVFLDKDAAISELKSRVQGQKFIERETMTEMFTYDGSVHVYVPGLVHEGVPVYAVRTRTTCKKLGIDNYTWRAVFEKETN